MPQEKRDSEIFSFKKGIESGNVVILSIVQILWSMYFEVAMKII